MKIGIEAQRIFRTNKHGMDYVVLQEILELQKIDHENEYFVFVAPGPDHCVTESENVHIVEVAGTFYPTWEQLSLPRAVRRTGVELLHCTSNTAPLRLKVPLILTLHDIIFLEPRDKQNKSIYQNMGWLYRRLVVPRILNNCRRIITVSQYERQNIISKLNISEQRIQMIYNGYNEWFRPTTDTNEVYRKYIDRRGYFLFLGNTDPKKNTERTLVAYALYLKRSEKKRQLLLADLDRHYLDDIISRNGIEHIRDHIVMPGYIVNSDLPYIYGGAFAFLYTSLRESFGIPLLEAMACGTPVITSNTSSMPEIAGTEAILIDPESPEAIADEMLKLEEDADYYSHQQAVGLKRARMFSWRKTAEQLLDLYNSFQPTTGTPWKDHR
jgi:glycosyltransferase involved in cell wall biosynthesis